MTTLSTGSSQRFYPPLNKVFAGLMVVFTILIASSLLWSMYTEFEQTRELAKNEARATFNKDQSFRIWATKHGGVYVPETKETPSNPYLSHIPDRDIQLPSGKRLTLMNPAYMMRQVMNAYAELYGVKGHITSLKLVNTINIPDEWERKALASFDKGAKEIFEFVELDGKPYLRLMRPMITKMECLKCHGYQGYKEGDVRGGVGVSVPLAPLLAIEKKSIQFMIASHIFIWLLGLIGIGFVFLRSRNDIAERKRVQEELSKYRCHLEKLVHARTNSLNEKAYELAKTIETLELEIIERRQAEQKIENLNQDLQHSNEELKAFTYTVSHDLKAPLRGIAGYADELSRKHSSELSERAGFCVAQILNAIHNLDRLIEDLLRFSRVDTETFIITEINLCSLVETILKDYSLVIAERQIEVTVDIHFDVLRTCERGLFQVLTNLIDNAIKYSVKAAHPHIDILAEESGNTWRIIVCDNGIGFDMKYHDRIFGLFNRLVRMDEYEGTGLGLAIVKKVLDKLGGRVWAEAAPGRGATFFVELPIVD